MDRPIYIGEIPGRSSNIDDGKWTTKRSFYVRSRDENDGDVDIITAINFPVQYGDLHPRSPGLYARKFNAKQDSKHWNKWVVEVEYRRADTADTSSGALDDNPILRQPDISYDTETIQVAARGEVDQEGVTIKPMANSAGEPYDPHPEDQLEIMLINITRWGDPFFSLQQFFAVQNSVNSNPFTFGDLVVEARKCKIRLRISKEQRHNAADGSLILYRQFDILLAINPLGWDLELLDFGTFYRDASNIKRFIDDTGEELGLLDGSGGKLATGTTEVYNFWKSKKTTNFGFLNLPAGP